MNILEVRHLSINYTINAITETVVNKVSFDLKAGQVLGIAGTSGSGKSTIAKSILGILPENAEVSGEIIYHNRNLLKLKQKEYAKIRGREISMIFQDPVTALNPVRTIKRQFYDILRGLSKDKSVLDELIIEKLSKVHLKNPKQIMEKYPYELSGGMKQRIVIAAAMALNPKMIIADEPTSAIDAAIKKQIILELKDLKTSENLSMIYISHNLAELKTICDEIIIMKNGVIVEQNCTEKIFSNPQEAYTIKLLEAVI